MWSGATSTAAVSFSDAKGATETLKAVAVNKNVRMAAIFRDGTLFARFDRQPDTVGTSIATRVSPSSFGRLAVPLPSTGNRFGSCDRFSWTAS